MLKNGFLTFCCAFIPGAGQMYQGYMKRGLSLILTACLIGMVSSLLNPVLLLLVVVWMYSFFDTFNLRAQIIADTAPADDYLVHFDPRAQAAGPGSAGQPQAGGLAAHRLRCAHRLPEPHHEHFRRPRLPLGPLLPRFPRPLSRHGQPAGCGGLCGPHRLRRLAGERPPSGQKSRMLPRMSPRMPISASITPTSRTTLLCSPLLW